MGSLIISQAARSFELNSRKVRLARYAWPIEISGRNQGEPPATVGASQISNETVNQAFKRFHYYFVAADPYRPRRSNRRHARLLRPRGPTLHARAGSQDCHAFQRRVEKTDRRHVARATWNWQIA